MKSHGKTIVLTADRTLMSNFRGNIFFGFASCLPTKRVPDVVYYNLFVPAVKVAEDGSARYANCALRTVEAICIEAGFSPNRVIVAHPNYLERTIGSETKVVGISVVDPLGIGPASTTWTGILGGESHTKIEFERLVKNLNVLRKKYNFKIVVGGPGAWQLQTMNALDRYAIDYLILGEAEKSVPKLFQEILDGQGPEDKVINAPITQPSDIPSIKHATIGGIIEISRGCGRGCKYCAPSISGRMRSLPYEKIVEDVAVNVKEKQTALCLQSEDILLYGSSRLQPMMDAVLDLFKTVLEVKGVQSVSWIHASLASIASSPELVKKLTQMLKQHGNTVLGCQPGIETGSPRLIEKTMRGKCYPFQPDEWPNVVREAFKIMHENRWYACATLMLGLPGEERDDVIDTLELVKSIDKYPTIIVPLFFVPMTITSLRNSLRFLRTDLTEEHWKLLTYCWRHNMRYFETLYCKLAAGSHKFHVRWTTRFLVRVMKFLMDRGMRNLKGPVTSRIKPNSPLQKAVHRTFEVA